MEKIILELYLARDWLELDISPVMKTKLLGFIAERICHDPLGHVHRLYSLTEKGKHWACFLLRRYGRKTSPQRGIAIEERSWQDPQQSTFSIREMEKSIKKFFPNAEIYKDWVPKRRRVIIKDIDESLDSVGEPDTDCDSFIINYLNEKRKLLREQLWVEIILWDT